MNELGVQIGRNIREARLLADKMTQRDLADAIGKSQTSVAAYEQASVMPPVDALIAIATATGTSLHFLVFGEEQAEVHVDHRCILTQLVRTAGPVSSIQVTLTIDPADLTD